MSSTEGDAVDENEIVSKFVEFVLTANQIGFVLSEEHYHKLMEIYGLSELDKLQAIDKCSMHLQARLLELQ